MRTCGSGSSRSTRPSCAAAGSPPARASWTPGPRGRRRRSHRRRCRPAGCCASRGRWRPRRRWGSGRAARQSRRRRARSGSSPRVARRGRAGAITIGSAAAASSAAAPACASTTACDETAGTAAATTCASRTRSRRAAASTAAAPARASTRSCGDTASSAAASLSAHTSASGETARSARAGACPAPRALRSPPPTLSRGLAPRTVRLCTLPRSFPACAGVARPWKLICVPVCLPVFLGQPPTLAPQTAPPLPSLPRPSSSQCHLRTRQTQKRVQRVQVQARRAAREVRSLHPKRKVQSSRRLRNRCFRRGNSSSCGASAHARGWRGTCRGRRRVASAGAAARLLAIPPAATPDNEFVMAARM